MTTPIDEDVRDLQRLGYTQQLVREIGGFSNFAVSFSIISILTGAVLLYGYGLKFGGPVINTIGWPLVSLFTLAVAASMAEIASAYPTAGGLYYWAFRLGGRGWAWLAAWLNMIGQIAITAGIDIAASIYIIGAASRIFGIPAETTVPVLGPITGWPFQLAVMALILAGQVAINVRGIRLTARLSDVSVWWHLAGGAIIVFMLAAFGQHHSDAAFLLSSNPAADPLGASSAVVDGQVVPAVAAGELVVESPLFRMIPGLRDLYAAAPPILLFVLALLQAQWTYTGYDASAHLAEETRRARRNSAWAIVMAVAVSAVAGYVFLLTLTWCIPNGDIAATASDPYPVLQILSGNLPPLAANAGAIIIGGAMWLCGVASVTSMGRMWYAFARDNGMPGSSYLSRVNPKTGVPVVATVVTSILAILISIYAAAWFVVTSISTIALYLAYGIPIYLNWRNRRRGSGEYMKPGVAAWSLGRLSGAVNAVAVIWIAFITVVFTLPPNELVLWSSVLFALILVAAWWLGAKKNFRGPAVQSE